MLTVVGTAIFLYGMILVALFASQRRILFVPNRSRPDLATSGLGGFEVVQAWAEDGLALEGWWHPASAGKPSFLYFQGNAGHIGMRAEKAAMLVEQGFGVLLAGYRGYGGNPGHPTEAGLALDAKAWVRSISDLGVASEDLVLYGESLGSGVVARLALGVPARAVVLEAPYTAVSDIAAARYWFLPVRALVLDKFDTRSIIGDVTSPVLIVHGSEDRLIPLSHGEAVFAKAREPKRLEVIEGGGHTNLFVSGAVPRIAEFVTRPRGG
jgi:hypothetical protein